MDINSTCSTGHCDKPDAKGHGPQNTREGSVHFSNQWGTTLAEITIRHRRGNEADKEEIATLYNVEPGTTLEHVMPIVYETGMTAPFDYWWVQFRTVGGAVCSIKDNFFCNISSDDDGQAWLTLEGGDKQELRVAFSSSSSCEVSISEEG